MKRALAQGGCAILLWSAASGCRETCYAGEVRAGEKCVRLPDATTASHPAEQPPPGDGVIEHMGMDASIEKEPVTVPTDDAFAPDGDSDREAAALQDAALCTAERCEHGGLCTERSDTYTCDCAGTGYAGESCELEVCPATVIRTKTDVDAARNCGVIEGDLTITIQGISDVRLPNLRQITGRLLISDIAAVASGTGLETATFDALETVDSTVQIISFANRPITQALFPKLSRIGAAGSTDGLRIEQVALKILEMPALTTVRGSVRLSQLPALCSMNMRSLKQVTGPVVIDSLPNVPATSFAALRTASRVENTTANHIGCCLLVSNPDCTPADVPEGTCALGAGCP